MCTHHDGQLCEACRCQIPKGHVPMPTAQEALLAIADDLRRVANTYTTKGSDADDRLYGQGVRWAASHIDLYRSVLDRQENGIEPGDRGALDRMFPLGLKR